MKTKSFRRIDCDDIDLKERIGRGTYSVFKAEVEGNNVAVKIIDCNKHQIPQEVEVYNKISHSNLLPILKIAHSKDGFSIYVCMELADKSLYHYLHTEKKKPSLQQSTKWAIQIAKGMHHIHPPDLKSANVLLFEGEDVAKVCDFGSARVLERTATVSGMTGTYRWMAPEFNDKADARANQRCDVFSYGMVLYEIFTREIPFSEIADGANVGLHVRDGERPSIPPELPLHIKMLMQSCWKHNFYDRPKFEGILQVYMC